MTTTTLPLHDAHQQLGARFGDHRGFEVVLSHGDLAAEYRAIRGTGSILDAIRHLGVKDIDMPTTPYRVWSAIQKASGTAGRGDEANIASPGAGLGSTASDISKGDTQGGHL